MKLLFVTGAGISAAAGIPTYRDEGNNSWRDKNIEKMSHASRYGNYLEVLWERHWLPIATTMSYAQPTQAHRLIAGLRKDHDVRVVTQNIDHLHETASDGDSTYVGALHGDMQPKCMKCRLAFDFTVVEKWDGSIPVCPACGSSKVRPNVVLFGEKPSKSLYNWAADWSRDADYIVAVGTSLNVFPAAALVMDQLGKVKTVSINPGSTKLDPWIDILIKENADEGMLEFIAKYVR